MKRASARLIAAKDPQMPGTPFVPGCNKRDVIARMPASSRLASGPATATRYSCAGSRASLPICATPPKKKSVTRLARRPYRRATAACDSSWTSTNE